MSDFNEIPPEVRQRASKIRLAAFDVDGTLTDGRLWFDQAGNEMKAYHVQDGLGLRLLADNGIAVALITARDSASVRARAKDLRLEHVFTGVSDKLACLNALCEKLGITLAEVAYMGDDLPDLSVLSMVGMAVAPADGSGWILDQVHWVTPQGGGDGAVRALCDLIVEERGLRPAILARFAAP